MGFIKHALIGIALYEAVKYILKGEFSRFDFTHERPQPASSVRQQKRTDDVDVIAGARQTDQLQRLKEDAASGEVSSTIPAGIAGRPDLTDPRDNLTAGSNPETPLAGQPADRADSWKNSLADDELRAPDS
jgi:hypothetical protein